MKSAIILTVLIALAGISVQDTSIQYDCSDIVTELSSGVLNWLGNIQFASPLATNGWLLTVTYDQIFTGVGVWDAWVTYNGAEKWARFTNRYDNFTNITPGQNFTFNFRINYGTAVPKPKVTSMVFQGLELCK